MHHLPAPLLHNRPELQDYRVLELHAPAIAASARPGQFVHVRVGDGADPLLRRPISIMLVEPHAGLIRLLVKQVGRGTELLARLAEGATVDLMGPLGNGFAMPPAGKDVLLVAGGVGVAPLIMFADALQTAPGNYRVRGLYGGRDSDQLPVWTEFGGRCEEFVVTTEDGSAGHHGLVTDLLPETLEGLRDPVVLACGPRAMLAQTAAECRTRGVPCYVSFEAWLGCGVGACLGCVIPAAGEPRAYLRVCRDGPVFDADEVGWDSLR